MASSDSTRQRWMRLAFEEAERALADGEVPVGAIVVRDGILLGRGYNRTKALGDPTAHAEMLAITAACEGSALPRLDGADIFVTLEPCAMCAGALVLARVKRLFFAARDPRAGACGSVFDIVREPRLSHTIEVYPEIDPAKSAEILDRFFSAKRHLT